MHFPKLLSIVIIKHHDDEDNILKKLFMKAYNYRELQSMTIVEEAFTPVPGSGLVFINKTLCYIVLFSIFINDLNFGCDFLDGDISFECCSIDPLTGSHYVCRRSPRLLTNGYYIWTEDSFLCDTDGHITLNPSHTSVMYKENLVKASKSWLHGSIFGDIDSPPSEDIWLDGIRSLGMYYCNENGDLGFCIP
ncbi:hypothetical protein STEG23_018090 [Scotinomys teguina]